MSDALKEPALNYDDQLRINEFNRVYQMNKALRVELKKLDAVRQKLIDCNEELELSSDAEIDLSFADCFLQLPLPQAAEVNARRLAEIEADIKQKGELRTVTGKRITDLRAVLTAKFGDKIRLEE